MSNAVAERLTKLRASMKAAGAQWYFMTSDDYHCSEYVADYFKVREHFTGFTGENAFLIVNPENAYMWTDGRFFIQAERELAGSGIELMRMGEAGVPTVTEFLKKEMKDGDSIFFDGKSVSAGYGKKIDSIVSAKKGKLVFDKDLAVQRVVSKLLITTRHGIVGNASRRNRHRDRNHDCCHNNSSGLFGILIIQFNRKCFQYNLWSSR